MASTIPYNPTVNYGSYNPGAQSGSGTFGAVPGAINTPNMAESTAYNLPGTTAGTISSELAGTLSPGTQNLLQTRAAEKGVSLGNPGGGMTNNAFLANLGLTSENLAHQGVADYSQFNPATVQADVATQNAVNAAAPNPEAAAQYAQELFDKYLAQTSKAPTPAPSGEYRTGPEGNFLSGSRALYNQYG